MSLQEALNQILTDLEQAQRAVVLDADAVVRWAIGNIDALIKAGLLKTAGRAQSVVCPGCEHRCISDVNASVSRSGGVRVFVVCEMPDVQAQMGRIEIAPDRLRQWQITPLMLARFLMLKLQLVGEIPSPDKLKSVPLGMLPGPHGRRWVRLVLSPLSLEINRQRAPMKELLHVIDDQIALDRPRVAEMLAHDADSKDKAYSPSIEAREAGKLATAAMRQDWHDAHAELARQHPDKGKRWYSMKIAQMQIARGRDAETIRKQLN